MGSLFDDVCERSAIPRVVQRPAMRRALARAGLSPGDLTSTNLARALESIHETLRVYHDDAEAETRLQHLRELCAAEEA
ncbi:MAG: hypothetical protein EVA89_21450 [Sandaracinaceae bacterium]|nr:MAG: hypothetical protein EVA89_21450 [Sandaracinaceae bacterium]